MQLTTNYGFKKPEGNDNVNVDDLNYNMDIADTELKKVNEQLGDKVNYTDFTPITTTGTDSAYIATIPENITEVTIVPHINNLQGATLNSIQILDREGKPIEKDVLKINIPTKLVRVGSNFFIASGGGSSDEYDYSIKVLAEQSTTSKIYKEYVLVADDITKTYVILTSSGQFMKKDYKTKETLATISDVGVGDVRFDKYTRCISTNVSIFNYDTFAKVSGKRKIYPQDNTSAYSARTTAIDEENGNAYTLYQKTLTVTNVNNETVFTKLLSLPGGDTFANPSVCVTKDYFVVLFQGYESNFYLFDKTNGNFVKTMPRPSVTIESSSIRGRKKDNLMLYSNRNANTVITNLDLTINQHIYLNYSSNGAMFLQNGKILVFGKNPDNTSNIVIFIPETGIAWKTIPITTSYSDVYKIDNYTMIIGEYEFITFVREYSVEQYIGIKTNFSLIEEVV